MFLREHLKIIDLHKIWKYYNRKSNVPTERKIDTFIFFSTDEMFLTEHLRLFYFF